MNKLIRGEIYRTKRINIIWVILIMIGGLAMASPFLNEAKTAREFFTNYVSSGSVFIIFLPMLTAFIAGRAYMQRTAMYEIMAGYSPEKILVSKCIAIALPVTFIFWAFGFAGMGIAAGMDSTGFSDAIPKMFLVFLIFLRASLFGVMVTACIRSMGSIAVVYGRGMIEMIILIIYSSVSAEGSMEEDFIASDNILINHLLSEQPSILSKPVSTSGVLQSVLGLVIEVCFWAVIYWFVNKKCDY